MKKLFLGLVFLLATAGQAFCANIQALDAAGLKELLEANRGKVIMLNFFATWCPPCRAEIPELVEMRKAFPEDKVLVVGLSVDDDSSAVEPFIKKNEINYPVFMAQPDLPRAYNVTSVPHNAFLAPDGRLIISEPGRADARVLERVVSDLLK